MSGDTPPTAPAPFDRLRTGAGPFHTAQDVLRPRLPLRPAAITAATKPGCGMLASDKTLVGNRGCLGQRPRPGAASLPGASSWSDAHIQAMKLVTGYAGDRQHA